MAFFRHGWQSWSLASWTDIATPLPVQKPRLLHAMQLNPNYAFHPYPHGSWVGAVEMEKENILLLGSLGLDAHVELNNNQLRGWYESGSGCPVLKAEILGWLANHKWALKIDNFKQKNVLKKLIKNQ